MDTTTQQAEHAHRPLAAYDVLGHACDRGRRGRRFFRESRHQTDPESKYPPARHCRRARLLAA